MMRNREESPWRQAFRQVSLIIFMAVVVGLGVNWLRTDSLPLVGDWPVKTGTAGDTPAIPLTEAARLFSEQAALFIDARYEEDYADGHIKGALNLPWDDAVHTRFLKIAGAIPPDRVIITYCDGETCHLSHDLAVFLREKGFETARELVNGWTVWRDAGLPVERGNGTPP
jgi:rhodanese-related sulfurtransferase